MGLRGHRDSLSNSLRVVLLLAASLMAGPAFTVVSSAPQIAPVHDHDTHHRSQAPSGHAVGEGFVLAPVGDEESVRSGAPCSPGAAVREYRIAAITLEITMNRFLDYDPEGRMYVLEEEVARVRREEAQNKAARDIGTEPAVSIGLQGDAIQPLVLRVNQGECLRITLRNDMKNGEPVSVHLHGSGLYVVRAGGPAIATKSRIPTHPVQSQSSVTVALP